MAIGHPARTGDRYVQVWAGGGGDLEHRVVAAAALGRPLPDGCEVHHANGNPRDNRPQNLVICQDKAYHKLLHYRERIVRAGGNPNTQRVCSRCRLVLDIERFGRSSRQGGTQTACKACMNAYRRVRKAIPEPNEVPDEWRAA